MPAHSKRRPTSAALVLVLICAATGGPGAAEPDEESPSDPIAKQLKRIGALLTNSGSRLRNGIVGMNGPDGAAPSTAAQRCCAKNIERIEQSLAALQRSLAERKACYVESGNATAGATIDFSERDMATFRTALGAFAAAPDNRAMPAFGALTRPYRDLRNGLEGLQPCPAADQGKKNESKKKKKSEDDEPS